MISKGKARTYDAIVKYVLKTRVSQALKSISSVDVQKLCAAFDITAEEATGLLESVMRTGVGIYISEISRWN